MPKIAIIGAGMNGLAQAIALCQLGFSADDIVIYEKGDAARAEGTGIIFWSETIAMLKEIGVDLTGFGVPLSKLKSLFAIDANATIEHNLPDAQPGKENYGFLREDIYHCLLAKAESYGLHVQTGFKCKSVTQDETGCTIHFSEKEPVRTEIVIACDGINSVIRKSLAPEAEPIELNIRAYRGIYTACNEDIARLRLPTTACDIHCNPNARIVLFPVSSNTKNTMYYWFAAHRIDPSELSTYTHNSPVTDAEIEKLIDRIPFCAENLKAMFRETPHNHIMRSATLRQSLPMECGYGRIALLGDCPHSMAPTGGLGFLLGLVNSLYLAGHLRQYMHDMPTAIAQYSHAIATHSANCLDHNMQLTKLFYVSSPKDTAAESSKIYQALFQFITMAASDSISFYIDIQRDFAARSCQAN